MMKQYEGDISIVESTAETHQGNNSGVHFQLVFNGLTYLRSEDVVTTSVSHNIAVKAPQQRPEINDEDAAFDTILIVDDEIDVRQMLVHLLRTRYRVLQAADGREGLRVAVQESPDLILSDYRMDDVDGLHLLHELKNHSATSHIPFIMMSALDTNVLRSKSFAEKADYFLRKPFDLSELEGIVQAMLQNRRQLKQYFQARFSEPGAMTASQKAISGVTINRHQSSLEVDEGDTDEDVNHAFVSKIDDLVARHYAEQNLNVERLADKVGLSSRQFSRKLKALTGFSPTEYLRHYRMLAASRLLKQGHRVEQVAEMTGHQDVRTFRKSFKGAYDITPKQYQQQCNV